MYIKLPNMPKLLANTYIVKKTESWRLPDIVHFDKREQTKADSLPCLGWHTVSEIEWSWHPPNAFTGNANHQTSTKKRSAAHIKLSYNIVRFSTLVLKC